MRFDFRRRSSRVNGLRVVACCLLSTALVVGSTSARVLTDKATGLKVKAPSGFRLKASGGIYTVTNGHQYVKFVLAHSSVGVSETTKEYIRLSALKKAKKKKKGSTFVVTGKLKGKPVQVEFKAKGANVSIATYGGLSTGRASRSRVPLATPVTVADILTLKRIVASRRGGVVVPFSVPIPMRRLVGQDGTSAFIPDRPGWTGSANGGVVFAANANEGIVELGVPQYVNVPPQNAYGAPVSFIVPAGQAIVNVWPQYAAMAGASVRLLAVQEVPGTEGWLGSFAYSSGMYAIRFTLLGRTWSGLMVSGVFSVQLDNVAWSWYHSYVAVPDNGVPGMGAALLNTWATWDNSAASQARLNQALATVLSTRAGGGPIDPEVFQAAADNWSAYIRE